MLGLFLKPRRQCYVADAAVVFLENILLFSKKSKKLHRSGLIKASCQRRLYMDRYTCVLFARNPERHQTTSSNLDPNHSNISPIPQNTSYLTATT